MEEKKTRKSKAQYIAEGVAAGIGTEEELKAMSVPEIKKALSQEMTVTVDISEEVGEVLECAHEWKRVKVLDPKGNYLVIRCVKCQREKPVE